MRNPTPTDREIQVLTAITHYGTIAASATALGLSPHTVDAHLDQLRRKSGFHYLPQILAWASTNGWIEMRMPEPKVAEECVEEFATEEETPEPCAA